MAKNITIEDIQNILRNTEVKLGSTHTRLSLPIINRIYKKMMAEIKFPAIKVQDNFICNGHHRYIASLLADYNLEKIQWDYLSKTNIIDWESVSFDENDWDNVDEIDHFNKQDADFNNISLDKIIEILK
jgi:hypothetical protein